MVFPVFSVAVSVLFRYNALKKRRTAELFPVRPGRNRFKKAAITEEEEFSMVQKFLDMVRNDPKAKELVKALPAPKSDAEAVEGYVKLAKDLGFDLTFDEIKAGLKGMEQAQKAQSEKVSLGDADLESVAGGANEGCDDTHTDGEWCWFTDSCSYIITYYGSDQNSQTIKEECFSTVDKTWTTPLPENKMPGSDVEPTICDNIYYKKWD